MQFKMNKNEMDLFLANFQHLLSFQHPSEGADCSCTSLACG